MKRKTAATISKSPADTKDYGAVRSRGEPRLDPSGAPVAYNKFPTVRSRGEPKTNPAGASPADAARSWGPKPNLKNRAK